MQREGAENCPAEKTVARIVCILFIAATLLTSAFVLSHAGHEHDHNVPDGSCATCAQLSVAVGLLKSIMAAVVGLTLIVGGRYAVSVSTAPADPHRGSLTQVGLKVRLNH